MRNHEAQLIHDLRNAATVIRGAALQLDLDPEDHAPALRQQLTRMIERRSEMLVRLIGELSIVNELEHDHLGISLQRVELAEVCDLALAQLGHALEVDVEPGVAVIADPVRLTQVLDNLVTNAMRYGGHNITLSAVRLGSSVQILVHDDGPGLPGGLVEDDLEPVPGGPRPGRGGLGLVIVRELVAAMRGTIAYDGSLGARFTLSLPAALPPSEVADGDAPDGHAVVFWQDADLLIRRLARFVTAGLTAGEAVVVASRPEHDLALRGMLQEQGLDLAAVLDSGQLVPLDASSIHESLPVDGHIDREQFDLTIGHPLALVRDRWRELRVFGEIVDLYWRQGDGHLALELEDCWDALRAGDGFRLLCGYELGAEQSVDVVSDAHDDVVFAVA